MIDKKKSIDFEKSLKELEKIVEELESGELSLEQTLKSFEQGIKLSPPYKREEAFYQEMVKILRKNGRKKP